MQYYYLFLTIIVVISFVTGVIVTIKEGKINNEIRESKLSEIVGKKKIIPIEVNGRIKKDEPVIIANLCDDVEDDE